MEIKKLFAIICFFLVACQDVDQHEKMPFTEYQINYSDMKRLELDVLPKLPSVHTPVYYLRFKDKPVSDILDDVSDLVNLPIYIDPSLHQKSKNTHMTLVANKIPLQHVLNWCARALDCQIVWLEGENLVYLGHGRPPLSRIRKYKNWPIRQFLSEYKNKTPTHVITFNTDVNQLEKDRKIMVAKYEEEQDNYAKLEKLDQPLHDFISKKFMSLTMKEIERITTFLMDDRPFKDLFKTDKQDQILLAALDLARRIPLNHNALIRLNKEQRKALYEKIQKEKFALQKIEDPSIYYRKDYVLHALFNKVGDKHTTKLTERFNDVIQKLSLLKEPFDDDVFLNNIASYNSTGSHFLKTLIPLLKTEEGKKLEPFKNFAKLPDDKRTRFYEVIVTEVYRQNKQHRSEEANLPLRKFVQKMELPMKKVTERVKNIEHMSDVNFENFKKSSREEAARLFEQIFRIMGPHCDTSHYKIKTGILMGRVNRWERYIINSYLYALQNPDVIRLDDVITQYKSDKDRSKNFFYKKILANVKNQPLDDVLYQWATHTGIAMGYVVTDLPALGQARVTLNKNIQTFEASLNDLINYLADKQFNPPRFHAEDTNILWIGKNQHNHFSYPLPYQPKTIRIPLNLKENYDASFIAGYLITFLKGNPQGVITACPNNLDLLIIVPERVEKQIKFVLASANKTGKLPKKIR